MQQPWVQVHANVHTLKVTQSLTTVMFTAGRGDEERNQSKYNMTSSSMLLAFWVQSGHVLF